MPSGNEETGADVIRQIFAPDTGWYDNLGFELEVPTFDQLEGFAALLARQPPEEELLDFIARHPQILTGNFGWADDATLAFFVKPPVGNSFKADFSVLHYGQGGCAVHLVEIERSAHSLFNKDLSVSARLRAAAKQVEDWHEWIRRNTATFVSDAVASAKKLPLYADRPLGGSYRAKSPETIEGAWTNFGGYDDPAIRYHIVIGRWAQLSAEEQSRLVFLNRQASRLYDVTTYDQLARRAFDRPNLRN